MSSETTASLYHTSLLHMPEDILRRHCHGYLRSSQM